MKKISGTNEWAVSTLNIQRGCDRGCLYCYAKAQAIRFGRATPTDWRDEKTIYTSVTKNYGKRRGRIMFPTSHDITARNVDACCRVLERLVEVGNDVLVVSKPRSEVMRRLRHNFDVRHNAARERITFRFTIGASDPRQLAFWEPGAPLLAERIVSLVEACKDGWKTSVSMEPMLDTADGIINLVHAVMPYVTDTVWLGVMNKAEARLKTNGHWMPEVEERLGGIVMGRGEINRLYRELGALPKVRWKESCKTLLGLPLATEVGADI